MAIYYEDGQLSRIVFNDKPAAEARHRLYDIGTHITFVKQIAAPAEAIAVAIA